MARKQSLDEHFLDNAPTAAELEAARNRETARKEALQAALGFVRANRDRITVTAETEDGETVTDVEALEAALEEATATTLKRFLENPEAVTLNGGWGHFDSLISVKLA